MSEAEASEALVGQVRRMARGARNRARRNGLPADSDLINFTTDLFHAQHGRCALTGLPFHLREVGTGKARRAFAPSLDRIEGDKGYTRDNVRLVCQMVNFALNRFGEDIFYEIAKAAVSHIGDVPDAISSEDEDGERERKKRYIEFVADHAPALLRDHGGVMRKADLRKALRRRYQSKLPVDEANAYGWAFRRLTEAGVIFPASNSATYELRR